MKRLVAFLPLIVIAALAGVFLLRLEQGGDPARIPSALIGKPVVFTTKVENVLAASCEGDMDCGKSDSVEVIQTITAAP